MATDTKIKLTELLQGKQKLGHDSGILGRVSIVEMKPVISNKSLIISSVVTSSDKKRQYETKIAFYGLDYKESPSKTHVLTVKTEHETYYCPQLTSDMYVQIRCNCLDFYFTWAYPDGKSKALLGALPKPYVRKTTDWPARNPANIPGTCKHLTGLVNKLLQQKILIERA